MFASFFQLLDWQVGRMKSKAWAVCLWLLFTVFLSSCVVCAGGWEAAVLVVYSVVPPRAPEDQGAAERPGLVPFQLLVTQRKGALETAPSPPPPTSSQQLTPQVSRDGLSLAICRHSSRAHSWRGTQVLCILQSFCGWCGIDASVW